MKDKNWKKILGLGLAFSLAAGSEVFAEITVPPIPVESVYETSQPSQNTGGGTENGGQNQDTKDQGAQLNSGQTAPAGGAQGLPYTVAVTTKDQTTDASQIPEIKSQAAVVYDVTHDKMIYEKDANTRYYPASITKLMTALLVIENCNLTDTVIFSSGATSNLEAGSVSLKITGGDQLSVKDCLYGLLLKSANEIANGLAEHVGGSIDGFVHMMNQRAAALGCTNTHFANPNGLNDKNHYTTAHDMALIAKAAFENQTLCQIDNTLSYTFPATQNAAARNIAMGHKMLYPTDDRYYPGIVGGKTGYTSLAGNTLVTCVEKEGVRLIVVILKSKQTHYQDTKALLDYGFAKVKGESQAPEGGDGPGKAVSAGDVNQWISDGSGWQFIKSDGNKAQNECMMIDGELYWFDQNAYMAVGWRTLYGKWYYFKSTGAMAKDCWVETEGYWYCVDGSGQLYTNTVTPDGFPVDEYGIWIR